MTESTIRGRRCPLINPGKDEKTVKKQRLRGRENIFLSGFPIKDFENDKKGVSPLNVSIPFFVTPAIFKPGSTA